MSKKILICTVGGSDKPVVTAVQKVNWDHVVFVCTEQSEPMITDRVVDQQAARSDTRPAIPVQAGISDALWSTLIVPPDDPDGVYAKLTDKIAALRQEHDGAQLTVDFTGGTKSMSAGAVMAVASCSGIAMQVVTGQRSDLVRVVDGTQQAVALGTERILLDRQIELLRAAWRNYGYQEAAHGFRALVPLAAALPDVLARLKFWRDLSERFAAWDRFDRRQAASNISQARRRLPDELMVFANLATEMWNRQQDPSTHGGPAPLVLFDLLRNAERCSVRGRYDDAVARCYRLWEWSAQWLLQADCGLDTSKIDPTRVPSHCLTDQERESGPLQIGSDRAWRLYRCLRPTSQAALFWAAMDGAGTAAKSNEERYKAFSQIRNYSILAHRDRPIDQQDCSKILTWTAGPFMEMVRSEARRLGQPDDMPQLPSELPELTFVPLPY